MPNWCFNELIITGDKEELDGLAEKMATKDQPFDFNKFIPYPEEYAVLDAKGEGEGYANGGYDWCINTWGTKWNAVDAHVTVDVGEITVYFDTAWSPVSSVVCKMAELYPNLTFEYRYEEGGNDFSGKEVYEGGECIISYQGSFDDYAIHPDEYDDDEEDDFSGENEV
jgi:hypothetical protein